MNYLSSVIRKIKKKNLTISVAESCTGGKVASSIVSYSGVSDIFLGGVVAYSEKSKINILKIEKNRINNYGTVSPQIAEDMCVCVKRIFNSDISISTTGNVGPSLGDDSSPLGKVFVAVNYKDNIIVKEYDFQDDRNTNINNVVSQVFNLLDNIL